MKLDRDQILSAILQEMNNFIPAPDTRADISIQQTSDESEIQDVIANIRNRNGDIKWIEDGAIMAYTNNKVALFQILDYLDENDNVLDYEVQLMQVDLNGVNVDVTDEIDIDDVRDMNNFFFKVLVFMDPEVITFDPVYVDIDEVIARNPYFDADGEIEYDEDEDEEYQYVYENLGHVSEYVSWKGSMNETYILFEKKGEESLELHLVPPKTVDPTEYFDINKFNVDAADDNGAKKMFQDMGFTMTNQSKNKDIDYEMRGKPGDVVVYDIEKSNKEGDKIVVHEMLNTITETVQATLHSDYSTLTEVKKRVKMNFKGKKRIKMQCNKGFKYVPERRVCVKITGSEMMDMKRSHIRAKRTKKAAGSGYQKRINKKTKRAMRFRKQANIPNNKFV